jgi:hypothetical protein
MKKINILLLILILIPFISLKAQVKKDYIKNDQLYLRWNNKNISFDAITNATIIKLLGKPIKVSKDKWETIDEWVTTYTYKDGEINIEKTGGASFITVKHAGWAFMFKQKGSFTKPFTIGTKAAELKAVFPHSVLNKPNYTINIPITASGTVTESSIIFEVKNDVIISVELFSNES